MTLPCWSGSDTSGKRSSTTGPILAKSMTSLSTPFFLTHDQCPEVHSPPIATPRRSGRGAHQGFVSTHRPQISRPQSFDTVRQAFFFENDLDPTRVGRA